jgi:hypothetical protein
MLPFLRLMPRDIMYSIAARTTASSAEAGGNANDDRDE